MNKTSVDMIKELRKVVDHGFKSQAKLPQMPKNDGKTFEARIRKAHCALQLILCEICCDTYTIWKIEHPEMGCGVRD